MATGEDSDDETLGGAQMHAEVSGLGEYLAEDERDALRLCREVVSHLNWRKPGPPPEPARRPARARSRGAARHPEPRSAPAGRHPRRDRARRRRLALRGVQAALRQHARVRLGERSRATRSASSATTACSTPSPPRRARTSSSSATRSTCRCSSSRTSPASWWAATSSRPGIIKKGSQLINAVTNSTVPHFTVIVGNSYGAGTYAMSRPRLQQPLHLHLAEREDRRDGRQADRGRDVDRAPRPGRAQGRALRRGGRRQDRRRGRGDPGEGLARARGDRRHQRRRHHRPARHAHGARHLPLGRAQQADRGRHAATGCSDCELHDACWSPTAARSRGA